MEKFKNKIKYDQDNRFIEVIYNLLEGSLNGDWTDNYKEGDEVVYEYDLNDEGDFTWEYIDCSYNSLCEFIGEGICIVEDDSTLDLWYNIEIKDDILLISFNYIDPDKF